MMRHKRGLAGAFAAVVLAGLLSSGAARAGNAVLVQDSFLRPNQSGWGAASDGGVWSSGGGLSILSNHGALSWSGSSQFPTLGSVTAADAEGSVRFSISAANETAGLILRRQANGDHYLVRYNGNGAVELRYKLGSTSTVVAAVTFKPAPSVASWLRFQLQGNEAMFKVWPDAQAEPAVWSWTGSTAAIPAAGQMGLYGWAAGAATVRFDSFSVVSVSGSPTPPPAGSLFTSDQIRLGVINGPNNGQAETDVNWQDSTTRNGWQVGIVPGYGGANVSFWSQIESGAVGPTQTSLVTSTPCGLMHEFTNVSAAFTGSEDYTFSTVQNRPPGTAVWVSFKSRVPAAGTDTNGLIHEVSTIIYAGDPGFLIQRFDLINPGIEPITLSASDSIELVLIGGLQQADATWTPVNGVYGTLTGSASAWPVELTPGDPDFYFITPSGTSTVQLGVEVVRKSGLQQAGATNLMFAYQQSANRLKIDQRGDLATVPGNTTVTFYALQALTRNLDVTKARSIAADYLSPTVPGMLDGVFDVFSFDDGAYHFASSSGSSLRFDMAMSSIDSSRWLTAFTVTNWLSAQPPSVRVGNAVLASGVDYVSTVDPVTHTAWVKLLKRLTGSGAPNAIPNGTIALS